jgi:FKBP-type peptidyl-prolyl cis-trans isomerase FkpA
LTEKEEDVMGFRFVPTRPRLALVVLSAVVLACSAGEGEGETADAPAAAAGPAGTFEIEHLTEGTGPSPTATDVVEVHYHGTFADGGVFDSSVERGTPARFPLNRVIPCWTQGVQQMKVGGKARLVCPPELAYGAPGKPPKIPPNATLTFEVELLGIQ